MLKQFYKKYLILRRNETIFQNFKISKNRKNLISKTSETSFKSDYIISTLENIYEPVNIDEESYITAETIAIMQKYLMSVVESNDGKNILLMYLTKNIGNRLFSIINDLLNNLSHFEFKISFKLIFADEFIELVLDAHNLNSLTIPQIDRPIVGYLFKIKNKVNKTKVNIIQLSYDDQVRLPHLATKFNEINMTKKKRLLSSKKKKGGRDITYILDEVEFEDIYYFSTFLDIDHTEESVENVKEVLYNIF